MPFRALYLFVLTAILAVIPLHVVPALAVGKGPSGLPLPRYVSLKSSRVNMRVGPGSVYQVQWLYLKRGLPMEIIQEYDNWRKVRDPEGNEGWILHSLLSGERTAIVSPWGEDSQLVQMHAEPAEAAALVARMEPGVIVNVAGCTQGWCKLSAAGVDGFVEQNLLWGVYPGENF